MSRPRPEGHTERTERLAEIDKSTIWHPFTQMSEWFAEDPLIIERGDGSWLYDTDGNRYLDGVSSLWCNVHGHRHPALDAALAEQATRIAHSTMLGMSNPEAIDLAERLVEITPDGLTRVFYAENGASAVEVAIKMAYQYWQLRGSAGRSKFVSLAEAYHGDTLGAVSVGGIDLFHGAYGPLLFDSLRAPTPFWYRSDLGGGDPERCRDACLAELDRILDETPGEVAAVIVEPLVQGAAGMIVHPDGFLRGVRETCDRHDVLLICDEVATGFGRTGKMFACEHEGVSPDLMVLGKGLTGGYLPLSATLATEEIFDAFVGEYDEFKTFFHGHTYTGNPLACAVAVANLEVFDDEETLDRLGPKIDQLAIRLSKLAGGPHVGEIRQRGMMVGIELVGDVATKEGFAPRDRVGMRVCMAARDYGIAIRPLGDVVVLMPPLSISHDEIDYLVDGLEKALEDVLGSPAAT